MNRALRIAATGMSAQQLNVDTIANNLANVNTTGFKKNRPEFQDLMYQTLQAAGPADIPGQTMPAEVQVGNGTITVGTAKNFLQGDIQPTSNPLDIAIQGEGFFQIRRPDGTLAYSRDGSFKLSPDGVIVNAQGYPLERDFTIPNDTVTITVGTDGTIEATQAGETTPVKVGQIELAKFVNVAGLRAIGNNMYVETPASGQPMLDVAGATGFGETRQSSLESSNVDIVEEMVSMIVAQRAYEANSKTVKTVEDLITMANNLKR
jgi:flagellar basal-body rod protein FlgG